MRLAGGRTIRRFYWDLALGGTGGVTGKKSNPERAGPMVGRAEPIVGQAQQQLGRRWA